MSFGPTQKQGVKTQIRWLIRRDMADVLEIERACFDHSWTEEDFLCSLRQRNCIGMVAEQDQQIVGFMIYELHKSKIQILNFAVAPWLSRHSIGSQMVERIIDKLSQQRRREIELEIRETNLGAQLFFKKHNFRAVGVLRHHYEDTAEDAYLMRFTLSRSDDEFFPEYAPKNRISELEDA